MANPIQIPLDRLCRVIGIHDSGANKELVVNSIRRMVPTTIESHGTLCSKSGDRYLSDTFYLFDRAVFKGLVLPDGNQAGTNMLYLSEWYLNNLNNGHVCPLNFGYQMQLRGSITARLYEILSVKYYGVFMHQSEYIRFNYHEPCAILPIGPQRHFSRAIQALKAAPEELGETGYIKDRVWDRGNG